MPKKHYVNLEVSENASLDEIKKAYKKLAMKHHPDRGGDEKKFKEINEAHDILTNPDKKQQYDMVGDNFSPNNNGFRPTHHYHPFQNMSFMHNHFFNNRANNMKKQPITQIVRHLTISLKEAYRGCKKQIEIESNEPCKCTKTCFTCKGNGVIEKVVTQEIGNAKFIQTYQCECPDCKGKKENKEENCTTCNNKRFNNVKSKFEVTLPERTFNDFTSKLNHPKNPNCEIIVKVVIDFPENFQRMRNDLLYIKKVNLLDALLGTKFEIEHPSGENIVIDYTNKYDTIRHDSCITLPSKGVHPKSNFVVKFQIDFPLKRNKLDDDVAKDTYKHLRENIEKLFFPI